MTKIQLTGTTKETPIEPKAPGKDFTRIRPDIMNDLVEALSGSSLPDEDAAKENMEHMSFYEAFDTWLRYNGISGYTDQILRCQNDLKNAGFGFKVHVTYE